MSRKNIVWRKNLTGKLSEKWPKDQNNEYVDAAYLKTCSQYGMEDKIIMSILEGVGIPSFTKFPHYGGFANLIIGQSAEGVDIYVPKTKLREALELINQDMEEHEV